MVEDEEEEGRGELIVLSNIAPSLLFSLSLSVLYHSRFRGFCFWHASDGRYTHMLRICFFLAGGNLSISDSGYGRYQGEREWKSGGGVLSLLRSFILRWNWARALGGIL
ncbi:hypothetical protein K402DRAFT_115068 [Aulographum hederae CBS 113979]|uniref:Uncharacterized protein n=1 Tax=Aulographum hederae CBS 113979 TaxID=1176131 RepID=A0A6G1GWX6_9PEZI|nr:hypothetical protein K402DRAFT_115068 [Aulographum hederae CBS 113979]